MKLSPSPQLRSFRRALRQVAAALAVSLLTVVSLTHPCAAAPSKKKSVTAVAPRPNTTTREKAKESPAIPEAAPEASEGSAPGAQEGPPPFPLIETQGALRTAVANDNYQGIEQAVQMLSEYRLAKGLENLEADAVLLVARARELAKSHGNAQARYLVDKALELAPSSGLVALRAFDIALANNPTSGTTLLKSITKDITTNPEIVLRLGAAAAPLIARALTLALFVTFILYLLGLIRELLSAVYQLAKGPTRGLVTPLFTLALLLGPLSFGPMWCITVWSAVTLLVLQRRTVLPFVTGLLLVTWGLVAPLQFSLNQWLDDPRIQALLRAGSGNSVEIASDLLHLEEIAKEPSFTGIGHYALAILALQQENVPVATNHLATASENLGEKAWLIAQQCLITLHQGDTQKAGELCRTAYTMGLRTPDFLFHYSRILFSLLDPEGSRELLKEAQKIDLNRTETLMSRERSQGEFTVPVLPAPLTAMVQLSLQSIPHLHQSFFTPIPNLMRGMCPLYLLAIGVTLIVMLLVLRGKLDNEDPLIIFERHTLPGSIQRIAKCVPGGKWAIAERPFIGWIMMSIVLFLSLPLIGISEALAVAPEALVGGRLMYGVGVGIVWLFLCVFIPGPRRHYSG